MPPKIKQLIKELEGQVLLIGVAKAVTAILFIKQW